MPHGGGVLDPVTEALAQFMLRYSDSRILFAVSGGRDSMVMIHAALACREFSGVEIHVGHVHHGLRGETADRDASFVKTWCENAGIPVHIRQVDAPERMAQTGEGAEEAARALRYDALLGMCKTYGLHVIATAHHAQDQMETILHHIFRGTGMRGMRGMKMVTARGAFLIARPLLHVRPTALTAYQCKASVPFVHDETNDLLDYRRNRIRHTILPLLRVEFGDHLDDTVGRMAEVVREEDDALQQMAQAIARQCVVSSREIVTIVKQTLLMHHVALQRRVVKLVLERLLPLQSWEYRDVERIRELAIGGEAGRQELSSEWQVAATNRLVRLERRVDVSRCGFALQHLAHGDCLRFSWFHLTVSPEGNTLKNVWQMRFAALAELAFRPWQTGDRVRVSATRERLVSDLFNTYRVPAPLRRLYPVFVYRGRILWVPGLTDPIDDGLQKQGEMVYTISVHPIFLNNPADHV